MKKSYLKAICILLLLTIVQVFILPTATTAYAITYTCGNLPLNSDIVYDCGSPLNAGGTPGHYEGGTVCSPSAGSICNVCGGNYATCPHSYGQVYGGTWVPTTPNTHHVHGSTCAYHYTTHTHTASCPSIIAPTVPTDSEEYLDVLVGELGGMLTFNDNASSTINYEDNSDKTVTKTIIDADVCIRLVNGRKVIDKNTFAIIFAPPDILGYAGFINEIDPPGTASTVAKARDKSEITLDVITTNEATMTPTIIVQKVYYGENSTNVKNLQNRLIEIGYWVNPNGTTSTQKATGYFGKVTMTSLIKFQREVMHLQDSAIYYGYVSSSNHGKYVGCGPLTMYALNSYQGTSNPTYSAYIIYDKNIDFMRNQADDEFKELENQHGVGKVKKIGISFASEFKSAWNNIAGNGSGGKISNVTLIFHGNPFDMFVSDSNGNYTRMVKIVQGLEQMML